MPIPSINTSAQFAQTLWESSADAWLARVDQDANRSALLDPVMVSLVGPPGEVLDVGCGEGRFCRLLASRGFRTVGLDPTEKLLSVAQQRDPSGEYVRGSGEALPFGDCRFDLTVSYLSLLDIPDFSAAIIEMERVTKPGGRILIALCTPYFTFGPDVWARNERGEKLHVQLDNYVQEHAVRAQWCGIDILNYHRSMSDYLQAFLAVGLRLEHFSEPVPSAEALQAHPGLEDNLRVPNFMAMLWRKE